MIFTDEQIEQLYKDYILKYKDIEEYEKYTFNTESEFHELLKQGEVAEITPPSTYLSKRVIVETAFIDMIKRSKQDPEVKPYQLFSDLETYLAMYIVFTLNNKLYIERN
ncbi:hypothetical protein [Enterococcus casseliflavus]|uniref:hypothetical protein n=1 Tax=Enterococcus casseliflavus TaxID=37734 RepID=UPI0030189123